MDQHSNIPSVPSGGGHQHGIADVTGLQAELDAAAGATGIPDGGTTGQVLAKASGTDGDAEWVTVTGSGLGDVVGPASATDSAVARFDATTGKLLQNSPVTIGDTGNVAGVANLTATSATINGAADAVEQAIRRATGQTADIFQTQTEVGTALTGLEADGSVDIPTGATYKINGTAHTHAAPAASAVAFTPAGTIAATNVQAAIEELAGDIGAGTSDAELLAIAGLTSAANKVPYFTGSGTAALATLTATGRVAIAAADPAEFRSSLGLAIGTDIQAQDAELAAIAGLTSAADRVPYFTGSGTAALATLTAAGRALLDDADAAAQRTTLGVVAASLAENSTFVGDASGNPVAKTVAEMQALLKVDKFAIYYVDSAPVNGTVEVCVRLPVGCTVNSLTTDVDSGTVTVATKINGTDITGLAAVAVTSTKATTNATAANTGAVGDVVSFVFSSASTPVNFRATINCTRA